MLLKTLSRIKSAMTSLRGFSKNDNPVTRAELDRLEYKIDLILRTVTINSVEDVTGEVSIEDALHIQEMMDMIGGNVWIKCREQGIY